MQGAIPSCYWGPMEKLLSPEVLNLLVLFVMPGVVARVVYDRLVPAERRKLTDEFLGFITFSVLHFGLFQWLFDLVSAPSIEGNGAAWRTIGRIFFIVILPAGEAVAGATVLTSRWLNRWVVSPIPKPWDFYFGQRKTCWVILRLKSGRMIGGYFGDNSYATSYPSPEQVYLEEVWQLDESGHFVKRIEESCGAIVSFSECETMEMLRVTESSNDGQKISSGTEAGEAGRVSPHNRGIPADSPPAAA
jgi:hypothetical protein